MPLDNCHLDRHIDVFFGEVGEHLGNTPGFQGAGFGSGFTRGIRMERKTTKESVAIAIGSDPQGIPAIRVNYLSEGGEEITHFPTNTLSNILAGFMMSRFRRVKE